MKIKSLLLGSAAAMIAVSGAKAADAIIVEAEPMEYVKVCDMYGNGFFYIPGTEICMNINGYVRSTYDHSETTISGNSNDFTSTDEGFLTSLTGSTPPFNQNGKANTSSWTVRGRLNFDVRNETEYGTLRSELRLQGGDASAAGDQNVAIDRALIHLAGFRLGYSDTYWTTNHGYGAGTPAINDGLYEYDQAIFFDYTAKLMDGVSVTVGVQDSNGGAFGASSPDIYVGMNASFGALTVAATAIRDDYIDVNGSGQSKDEWAYKVSAIMGLGDSGWSVGGWYMADDGHTQYVAAYSLRDYDEQWGAQINGALTANLSAYAVYSESTGHAPGDDVDLKATSYAVGVIWAPVANLTVQAEYTVSDESWDDRQVGKLISETEAFRVRVTRSF